MRSPVYWIVIGLSLCFLIGYASAAGPHGGMPSSDNQGPSGSSSVADSVWNDSTPPISGVESESGHISAENLGTIAGTTNSGAVGGVDIPTNLGGNSVGSLLGYQEAIAAYNSDSSYAITNAGLNDITMPDNRGPPTSFGDSGASQGWGNPSESAVSDDNSYPGSGLATGDNFPKANPRGQNGLSHLEGMENGPFQEGGGEGSGLAREMRSQQGPEEYPSNVVRASQSSEPEQGQNGGKGSLGIMVASMGSAGMMRAGSEGSAGYSASGQPHQGPTPQRQQQGMPAQSGHYPCGPAQSIPVTPEQGQAKSEVKEDTNSRPRSKRERDLMAEEELDCPIPSSPASPQLPFFPFGFVFFGGYRRISKKNVLDQNTRNIIYQTIASNPGVDVPILVKRTGINENTIRYHLIKLIASGRVTYLVKPGIIRYFLNQGAYVPAEQVIWHYFWSDTPRQILLLLSSHPGLTRQQISDSLGISGPSVTRQMGHLMEDRLIENRFPGRANHYYLTDEAFKIFERLITLTPESEQPVSTRCERVISKPSEVY